MYTHLSIEYTRTGIHISIFPKEDFEFQCVEIVAFLYVGDLRQKTVSGRYC